MNKAMIRYILGYVLSILALLLLLPCLVALIYQEMEGFHYLAVAAFGALLGYLMIRKKPEDTVFHLKEGCIATALSWIVMSLYGCLPFWISGEIPSFTDALFDILTCTDAGTLTDLKEGGLKTAAAMLKKYRTLTSPRAARWAARCACSWRQARKRRPPSSIP